MRLLLRPLLAATLLLAAALAAAAPPEHEVRAAIVVNLSLYVEWPDLPGQPAELAICIAGHGPTASALLGLDGRTLHGLPVSVRSLANPAEGPHCRVLFIGDSAKRSPADWLRDFADRPVLTVSENDDFLAAGGMAAILRSGSRIVFDINLAAARRAGLRIGSPLLRLAREVRGNR